MDCVEFQGTDSRPQAAVPATARPGGLALLGRKRNDPAEGVS